MSFVLSLLLVAGGLFVESVKAEKIMLQNLYAVAPLDDSTETGNIGDGSGNPNYITARREGNAVIVDFKNPAGNAQVVVSRSDGSTFRQHSELNPQHITVDMSGAKAGRYLLEVYTDEDALGGMFEVK